MTDVKLSTDGLDKLIKSLKKPPQIRVGILGPSARTGMKKEPSNATVGAWHEFGTDKLPVRSFLRMPISLLLDKELQSAGAFDKEAVAQIAKEGSFTPFCKKVAVICEGIVADAFDTGGFGIWPPSDMKNKHNHQTLVETQQLRNSITSEVKEVG